MPLTDEKAAQLAQIVDDINERIATHSDAAIDALERVEGADPDLFVEEEGYRAADIELRRGQLHAALALALRIDILTQLVTVAALPDYDPPEAE